MEMKIHSTLHDEIKSNQIKSNQIKSKQMRTQKQRSRKKKTGHTVSKDECNLLLKLFFPFIEHGVESGLYVSE